VLVRRLTPVLALAAVVGLAASGCASQTVGVQVGDNTRSEADTVDELNAWGENEALIPPGQEAAAGIRGELADSYSQDFVADILQQRITFMLAEQLFDEQDLELTDDATTDAEEDLAGQIGREALDDFPEGYRQSLVNDVARLRLLAEELGQDEVQNALAEAATTTEIEVSPRFGEWDEDELGIVPPAGSNPAPGSGGPGSGPASISPSGG
jgi:hypothetical protein